MSEPPLTDRSEFAVTTPRTYDAWNTYKRGKCGTMYLRNEMEKLERELAEIKDCADRWKEYYRKAYGHAWENRDTNYQGL